MGHRCGLRRGGVRAHSPATGHPRSTRDTAYQLRTTARDHGPQFQPASSDRPTGTTFRRTSPSPGRKCATRHRRERPDRKNSTSRGVGLQGRPSWMWTVCRDWPRLTRQQAFAGLAERVDSDEVRLLTSSIIQSEQLGTSLVSTIKNQAQQLRSSRRRKAEAQALKAPVKMLLPMVLFILPALFI